MYEAMEETGRLRIFSSEKVQRSEDLPTTKYSRGFLFKCRLSPYSKTKPENLPHVPEIILNEPQIELSGGLASSTLYSHEESLEDHFEFGNEETLTELKGDSATFKGFRGSMENGSRQEKVGTAVQVSEPLYHVPIFEDGRNISLSTTERETPKHIRLPKQRGKCSNIMGKNKKETIDDSDNKITRRKYEIQESENTHQTEKGKRERIFGYKKLKELAESDKSPDMLVVDLLGSRSGFAKMIDKKEMQPDWVILLLRILSRVAKAQQRQSLLDLLKLLLAKSFLTCQLIPLLSKLHANQLTIEDLKNLIENILIFCKNCLERLPEEYLSSCKVISLILKPNLEVPNRFGKDTGVMQSKFEEFENILQAVQSHVDEKKKSSSENARKAKKICKDLQPPDNFRDLPILPQLKDLGSDEKPFLRANKTEGRYDDLNHYLDVQFRLLREDFVQPLRNGIQQYRIERERGSKRKSHDLRIYQNVHIINPVCSNDGILHVIQFDVSRIGNVRWESSKRLLHGSLLCLSKNDFETMLFATVTKRELNDLADGLITVRFEQDLDAVRSVSPFETFVMAETTAYFEAYRHILLGLQMIDENMPFQKYLVECNSSSNPPKYLLGKVHEYDFSQLIKMNDKDVETKYPVLNTRSWPSANLLHLDDSQYKALQMAITKELAIIQGPPGTGKTFLGLKIVQLLLQNKSVWSFNDSSDPLLVVCYTNHALDQFLEGIMDFCQSVIRIGGRCKSEALQPFLLKNCRRSARETVSRSYLQTLHERSLDCKNSMKEAKLKIDNISAILQATQNSIEHESTLEKYIGAYHFSSLCYMGDKGDKVQILEWLGIGERVNINIHEVTEEGELVLSSWKQNIINYSAEMEQEEAISINNPWDLQLLERVALYKLWTRLVRVGVGSLKQKRKAKENKTTKSQDQDDEYERILRDIEEGVLEDDVLMAFLPSEFRVHVANLKSKRPVTSVWSECRSVTEQWLCLDETEVSRQQINEALKEISCSDDEFMDEGDEENEARIIDDSDEDDDDDDSFKRSDSVLYAKTLKNLAAFSEHNTDDEALNTEGWTISKEMRKKMIRRIVRRSDVFSDDEIMEIDDIWKLNFDQRAKLYRSWLSKYQTDLRKRITDIEVEYSNSCRAYREVTDLEDSELIRGTKVVAMTTTGSAKYRTILQNISPKIIIVEEAAEVLESHIVTALSKSCQHLILIGDHKQLRPSPAVYTLATKYNLEISLFERMINNQFNFATLKFQHRMRPEISILMQHFYPGLMDHLSVLERSKIAGVENNIFFISHTQEEQHHDESRSHSNIHEAKFVANLCRYFINQGYRSDQITVLATYSGQVLQLKRLMPKRDFQGVRISAVDNFQGEENDIILLSLVRSNSRDSIGFLKTENRVCVALSRARMGLYAIGNFNLLATKSNIWTKIIETLQKKEAIGTKLILRCQNHSEKTTLVSDETDFLKCSSGGCDKPCEYELLCGHVCEQPCHILDQDHELYKCLKPCEQSCPNGHNCKKRCFQKCGNCPELIPTFLPVCNHKQKVPCHMDSLLFECCVPCTEVLSCGHICGGTCGSCNKSKVHTIKCEILCNRRLSCGHDVKKACHVDPKDELCPSDCNATLDCDHTCQGKCKDCLGGRIHIACQEKCKRKLICGHICNQKCGQPCKPCLKKCSKKCDHRKCAMKCGIPCEECKICSAIPDKLSCSEPCRKLLECKHYCMGIDGEPCPQICYYCDENEAKAIYSYCSADTKFIVLEDCKHVFELTTMDAWIQQIMAIDLGRYVERLQCPKCYRPITHSTRYGYLIRELMHDVEKIKSKLNVDEISLRRRRELLKKYFQRQKLYDADFKEKMTKLLSDQRVEASRIDTIKNQAMLLNCLDGMMCLLDTKKTLFDSTFSKKEITKINSDLIRVKEWVFQAKITPNKAAGLISQPRYNFTRQELREGELEILRLEYLVKFITKLFNDLDQSTTMNIVEHIDFLMYEKLDANREEIMNQEYRRSDLSETRIGMTPELRCPEKKNLIWERSFGRNMWCKCPCGSIFEIDDDPSGTALCSTCCHELKPQSINERPFFMEIFEDKTEKTLENDSVSKNNQTTEAHLINFNPENCQMAGATTSEDDENIVLSKVMHTKTMRESNEDRISEKKNAVEEVNEEIVSSDNPEKPISSGIDTILTNKTTSELEPKSNSSSSVPVELEMVRKVNANENAEALHTAGDKDCMMESGQTKVAWQWFRCAKGHLYCKKIDDENKKKCTECDKEQSDFLP